MIEPKWTPGPWRVINADDPHLFPSVVLHDRAPGSRPAQITINEGADGAALERGEYHGTTMETAAANACLIASAPELYAALAAIVEPDGVASLYTHHSVIYAARHVLRQARGENSDAK